MNIVTKAVAAAITDTSANADEYPGTFEVELSNESLDRDGDILKADEWETPLPDRIAFVNDHNHKMKSVVGSAVPELVDGRILCKGEWAETVDAQETRKVIKHVPYVSVAYNEKRGQKGGVTRELINGSFVVVPSNTRAKVLASKSVDELADDTPVSDLTVGQLRQVIKSDNSFEDALAESGLSIVVDSNSSTITVKSHGNILGAHKFSPTPEGAPSNADPDTADTAEVDAAALEQLKAAAAQFVTRTSEST